MRPLVVLLAHGFRRFLEEEELVLETDVRLEPERAAALDHAAQQCARADGLGRRRELAQEEESAVLERQRSAGVGQNAYRRIGIAGVPAGELDVVVELVLAVPAQHDVAESEPALERRQELLPRHVLAAQDPVDVEGPDLDVRQTARLDDGTRVRRALDLAWFHAIAPDGARPRAPGPGPRVTSDLRRPVAFPLGMTVLALGERELFLGREHELVTADEREVQDAEHVPDRRAIDAGPINRILAAGSRA